MAYKPKSAALKARYNEQIKAAKLKIRNATNERIQDVTLRIHATLVSNPPKGTPIDLGWASANWWISVGAPATGNSGTAAQGSVTARESEQQEGIAELMSYDYTSGQTIYVSNHVAYIRRLNYGWSAQSPAGFVEAASQEAVVWANNKV